MKLFLRIILISLFQWGMFITYALSPAQPAAVDIVSEEYSVYNALIEGRYITSTTERIVINDKTGLFTKQLPMQEELEHLKTGLPSVSQDMANEFGTKNDRPYSLKNLFKLKVPVILLSKKSLEDFTRNKKKGWDLFYARHPHSQGQMTLSRVGFNRKRDRALVYVGNQSHFLAGAGFYLYLEKQEDSWIIKNELRRWVS